MILLTILVVYMACAYRYRGGWRLGTGFDSPRWLELLAVSWPMGLAAFLSAVGQPLLYRAGVALLVTTLTAGAHSIGHGNAMTLGRRPYTGDERREIWDRIAGRLKTGMGYDERWRRDAIALALSGIVVLWPLAIAMALAGRWDVAGLLTFLGAAKVGAYQLGWNCHKEGSHWRQGTEIGEAVFGGMLGIAVAAAM